MTGDPPLNQVVTRTWEAGIRNEGRGVLSWNFGYFRADNHNDILFVTSSQSGFGYFRNFGRTTRQGLEAGLHTTIFDRFTLGGGYTFLNATYASAETVNGSGNSRSNPGSGLEGTIEIRPGDKIPLTARHDLKAFVDVAATRRLALDLNLIAISSSPARGNDNNRHEPDGLYYLGPGHSPGYGIVNGGARFELLRNLELVAELKNIFNKRYSTAAQLGSTGFRADGTFVARPFPEVSGEFPLQQATFYAPGTPRNFSVSTRVKF